MKKNKKNPNRIPLARRSVNIRQSTGEFAGDIVFLAWLEILGALADFPEMSRERIWALWMGINKTARKAHVDTEVEKWIRDVEEISGICLPYKKLSSAAISTQGELDRYMRRVKQNALSSAYGIIAHPVLEEEMLSQEDAGRLFQKAYGLDQELKDRRIRPSDILSVLEEELGLSLEITETGVKLVRIRKEEG